MNQKGLETLPSQIKQASQVALSIIFIIIGDEWEFKNKLDQTSRHRKFDNYHIVNFNNVMEDLNDMEDLMQKSEEFAKHVMMAVPGQYRYIKRNGYLKENHRRYLSINGI